MDKDKIVFTGGVFITLLLIGLSVLSYMFYSDMAYQPKKLESKETLRVAVEATSAPQESYKNTKITVLNASGVSGAAAKLKDNLTALGYKNIEIGNAALVSGNKLSAPRELAPFVDDLKTSGFTVYKFELSEEIVVTIGK